MYPDFLPRTPMTAGNNGQSLLMGFYASEIKNIQIPNLNGGHVYYIINLETNLIKFGITKNWRNRIKTHIAHFVCYAQAKPEKLWVVVSQKPINDIEVGEKLWLHLSKENEYYIPVGGKEFFIYMKDNLFMLDKFFCSLVDLMRGEKGKNIIKNFNKTSIKH